MFSTVCNLKSTIREIIQEHGLNKFNTSCVSYSSVWTLDVLRCKHNHCLQFNNICLICNNHLFIHNILRKIFNLKFSFFILLFYLLRHKMRETWFISIALKLDTLISLFLNCAEYHLYMNVAFRYSSIIFEFSMYSILIKYIINLPLVTF